VRKFCRSVPADSGARRQFEILKAIAADLRVRVDMPRSHALGVLARGIESARRTKGARGGYDPGMLIALAQTLINKWPTVSQALESFGEESAE
jgi:hypothetical protein